VDGYHSFSHSFYTLLPRWWNVFGIYGVIYPYSTLLGPKTPATMHIHNNKAGISFW